MGMKTRFMELAAFFGGSHGAIRVYGGSEGLRQVERYHSSAADHLRFCQRRRRRLQFLLRRVARIACCRFLLQRRAVGGDGGSGSAFLWRR